MDVRLCTEAIRVACSQGEKGADWISISSVIIAFASLVVAYWAFWTAKDQARQTEKHNRLSVLPRLHFSLTTNLQEMSISLVNNGIGPAEISSIELSYQGEKLVPPEGQSAWELVKPQLETLFTDHDLSFHWLDFHSGDMLGTGATAFLFKIENIPTEQVFIAALKEDFLKYANDLQIKVRYRSIYQEDFTASMQAPISLPA